MQNKKIKQGKVLVEQIGEKVAEILNKVVSVDLFGKLTFELKLEVEGVW